MEPEDELGADAKIATPSTYAPEKVGILVNIRSQDCSVSYDHGGL